MNIIDVKKFSKGQFLNSYILNKVYAFKLHVLFFYP